MSRRIHALGAALALLAMTSPASAQQVRRTLTTGEQADGIVTFNVDQFGALYGNTMYEARDPADKTQLLPSFAVVAQATLTLAYRSAVEGESQSFMLVGEPFQGWEMGSYINADPTLYDPATDVVTATTVSSQWRLTSAGPLADVSVALLQEVQDIRLVQTYTISNDGAEDITLWAIQVSDSDLDINGGFRTNRSVHLEGWPGAAASWPAAMTTVDSTELIGHTIAMEGGTLEGWRGIRARSVGWENYRVGFFHGYPDPATQLNDFVWRQNAAMTDVGGNGPRAEYDTDFNDNVAPTDAWNDAPGDVAVSLQRRLVVPAGGSVDVVVSHTFFSGGPWLWSCPDLALAEGETVDEPIFHTSGFGARTVTAIGLPDGVTQNGERLQGTPTDGRGSYPYTLQVEDERGRVDTETCEIRILGPCYDAPVDQACGGHVVYPVISDADGQPLGTARCVQAGDGAITCDTEADGQTLAVYPELWCQAP